MGTGSQSLCDRCLLHRSIILTGCKTNSAEWKHNPIEYWCITRFRVIIQKVSLKTVVALYTIVLYVLAIQKEIFAEYALWIGKLNNWVLSNSEWSSKSWYHDWRTFLSSNCVAEIYINLLCWRFPRTVVVDIWHYTEEIIKRWRKHIIGLVSMDFLDIIFTYCTQDGQQERFRLSNWFSSRCPRAHGPRFNTKMSSYQYRKSHCGNKTVVRSSYSYTGKMTSLYWFSPQLPVWWFSFWFMFLNESCCVSLT